MMNVNNLEKATDDLQPFLTFRLAEQYYALAIPNVLEVVAMLSLSSIPNAPSALLGIANRHGEALPILDLRIAFNLEAIALDVSTFFIVAQTEVNQVGLVVDEIFQVKYIPKGSIKVAHGTGQYVTHIISDEQILYQQIDLEPLLTQYLAPIK